MFSFSLALSGGPVYISAQYDGFYITGYRKWISLNLFIQTTSSRFSLLEPDYKPCLLVQSKLRITEISSAPRPSSKKK